MKKKLSHLILQYTKYNVSDWILKKKLNYSLSGHIHIHVEIVRKIKMTKSNNSEVKTKPFLPGYQMGRPLVVAFVCQMYTSIHKFAVFFLIFAGSIHPAI